MINVASGSVGPGAKAALEEIVSGFGLEVRAVECQPAQIPEAVKAAVDARPDLVVVLAGDGTARLAAELCGPDGPLVAPLPGGTMNMLPKALYGTRNWREALDAALAEGVVRPVSGGEVGGKAFYVAAILGAPALWADAREAMRAGKLTLAFMRAQRALNRAFSGRLRYVLDGAWIRKAEALTLICPLVSRVLTDEQALEADGLNPAGAAEAFRLALKAGLSGVLGDWRADPAVSSQICRAGRVWAKGWIPAILDGEPQRFDRAVTFSFRPDAFRALAPPQAEPTEEPAEVISDSVKSATA